MFRFKLNILIATSFIALTTISSLYAEQPLNPRIRRPLLTSPQPRPELPNRAPQRAIPPSGTSAELAEPTNGLMAARVYASLTDKANKGDPKAQQVLNQFQRSDFQDIAKAKRAVQAYNQALKMPLAASISQAPVETSEVPMPVGQAHIHPTPGASTPLPAQRTEEEAITLPMPGRAPAKAPPPSFEPDGEKTCEASVSVYKALAEKCITGFDREKKQLEEKIKTLEAKLGAAKQPETQKKRDFVTEYEELIKKLLAGADPREEERLNLELGKLEREAEMAGIPLGEAAEKKAEEQRLKEMKDQQMQARAALKAEEEGKDKQAYDAKVTWIPALSQQPLAKKLSLPDETLFYDFTNATASLRTGGMIEQEINENVLRALRHMIRKFQNKIPLTQKQKDELGFLLNKIDLRLSSLGVKGTEQNTQGGNFTALPEDEDAYKRFQYVWGEAQKNPSSKLYRDISRTRNTDELIKVITSPENSLPNISFDAVKLRSISFSKATTMELKAFKYALSQVRTSSFNPAGVKELTQTINDQIRSQEATTAPMIRERAQEEERMANAKFGQAKPTNAVPQQAPVGNAPPLIRKTLPTVRKEPTAATQQAIDPQLAKIVEKLQEQGVSAMRAYKIAGQLVKMGKTYGEGPIPQQDIEEATEALTTANTRK